MKILSKNIFSSKKKRSLKFANLQENRYWWYQDQECRYIPAAFSCLTSKEWTFMDEWYKDTEKKNLVGECSIPIISLLQGIITGNGVGKVVQLGHYSGFSTLLLGFYLRHMGKKNSLYTIDIDAKVSEYVKVWVKKVGLSDYVHVEVDDSANIIQPMKASTYLNGDPQLIFIDSSHQYKHTLNELNLWTKTLVHQGLIVLHDTSDFAASFDSTKSGGVHKAITEWLPSNHSKFSFININENIGSSEKKYKKVYKDGCGVGILFKT